jgi:hypothetical protein
MGEMTWLTSAVEVTTERRGVDGDPQRAICRVGDPCRAWHLRRGLRSWVRSLVRTGSPSNPSGSRNREPGRSRARCEVRSAKPAGAPCIVLRVWEGKPTDGGGGRNAALRRSALLLAVVLSTVRQDCCRNSVNLQPKIPKILLINSSMQSRHGCRRSSVRDSGCSDVR